MANMITLQVPEEISVRARQIAERVAQPVEQILLNHLLIKHTMLVVL